MCVWGGVSLNTEGLSQQLRGTWLIAADTFKILRTLVASQGPDYLGSQSYSLYLIPPHHNP